MKNTRRALFLSVVSMFLCVVMLASTTFAWFTDSVESTGNIIASGTLKVSMEWADGTKDVPAEDSSEWIDASTGAIFDYSLWEPGYTQVRHIKIANEGTLALKYQVKIVPNGTVSKLSDVIDVYYADPAVKAADRSLNGIDKLATLTNAIAGMGTTASGTLVAGASDTITIALKMQESAGNEYQNLEIGSNFAVQLLATQLTSEDDSFDDQYDAAATWIGNVPASLDETTLVIEPALGEQTGTITVNSPEDLVYLNKLANEWVSLYSNGQGTNVGSYRESEGGKGTDYYYYWTWKLELTADLDMNNIPMDSVNLAFWRSFEGNGHTIRNVVVKDGQSGLFTTNGSNSISNLNVKNIVVNAPSSNSVGAVANSIGSFNKVNVENATVNGNKYVGGLAGKSASVIDCSVTGSTVTGNDKTVGGLVGYSIGDPDAATVSGNTVYNVTVVGAYNVGGLLGQSQNETVENNTIKNVTVKSTMALPANASSNEVCTAKIAARSAFADTTIGTNIVENVTLIQEASVTDAGELKDAMTVGGLVKLDGKVAVEDLTYVSNEEEVTVVGGTLSRDTASGNPLLVNSTKKVTFEEVTFESVEGSAVLATRKDGANIEVNDCTFTNLAAPSTGNTGVQVYASNVTMVFNGCTFENMPIVTNSSYPDNIKLEFNDCTFKWTGANCPGMIQLANYVVADIDFNRCKYIYDAPTTSTWVNELVSTSTSVGAGTTVDFNNFEMIGTAMEGKVWSIVGKGGVTTGNNVTVTATGTNSYTFNGAPVDFDTYLFK